MSIRCCHPPALDNIEQDFNVENNPVKLQHDAFNSWWVITFTRQLDLQLVWKFKKVTQRSMLTHPRFGCGQQPYKVTAWYTQFMKSYHVHKVLDAQRSILNSSDMLMWRTPHKVTASCKQYLRSYCIHKGAWPWASLKVQKDHTKINIKLIRDFDVENTTIKLQLATSNLWRVIMFT